MASITGQQAYDRAVAYSAANDPGVTIMPGEALTVIRAKLRVLYNRATRINPFFSAVYEDIVPDEGKWQRPDGALRVILIEGTGTPSGAQSNVEAGVEVHNVSVKDRFKAADPPRVYRLGGCYYSVAEEGDPNNASEILRFYFAEDSPGIAGLASCLPDWFPDEHEELIVVQLAKHLAIKDKARGDINALTALEKELLDEFDAYAAEADLNVVGRFDRHAGEGLKAQGQA